MSKIFPEVLDEARKAVLPYLHKLPKGGVLGGGTALALQINHRISYDFDFFYSKPIAKSCLLKIKRVFGSDLKKVLIDSEDELTFVVKPDVKITLLSYPFPQLHASKKSPWFQIFDIKDIASAKAYSIGRRGVWRDYVDMYFLLKDHLGISTIIKEAQKRFKGAFNAKLFLQQLEYFEDLEDFLVEFVDVKISSRKIKAFLRQEVAKYVKQSVNSI